MTAFPLVVEPSGESFVDRLSWIERNKESLVEQLSAAGAIRFRALGADTLAQFDRLTEAFFAAPMAYVGGDSPRTRLSARAYTSTEFPAEYPISLHNELSYADRWPAQLLFGCLIPPDQGGETPVADCRRILHALEPVLVDEFTRRGVRYVRNLHGGNGFGRSWQQTFETDDRSLVEAYGRESATTVAWKADGGLQLVQRRPAVAVHPQTRDAVWFNQAEQYHPSTHPKPLYESLLRLYGDDPDELPSYATFGDGGEIGVDVLEAIRRTVAGLTVAFPWERGDALWLDNMLACHGRAAYRGPRQILVSMA